jgi:hypothetical protein
MPEQISKYPDVTLDVLKGAGARCGEGAPQNILKQCPAERFCALPTGEVCVYGISDIPQMTQITPAELARVVAPAAQRDDDISLSGTQGVMLGVVFLVGLALGKFWQKAGRRD